jgi:hypothetical protein
LPDNISEYNTVINETIFEKEVTDAIKSLKNNKACGSGIILNEFLKHAADKLMPPVFVKIFNIIFESGISRFHYGSKVPAVTITVFITTGTK